MTAQAEQAAGSGDRHDRISEAFDKATRDFLAADRGRSSWDAGYYQAVEDIEEYMQLLGRMTEQMRSHLHRKMYRYQRERNDAGQVS